MAVQVASLFGVLSLRDQGFRQGMQQNQNALQTFSGNLRTLGTNVTNAGRQMAMVAAPIALGLGVAVNASRNFSEAMLNVDSILGITGDAAAELRQRILEYGGSTRAGPQAVAEAYYDIVSGVADATTHMAILEAATRTSEAGNADLAATTSGLISIMNAYRLQAEDAAYVSDVFTRTVGMGVLTMDELAASLPLVTGLSSSMGLALNDVAGQMAYLTTQGFDAGRSATFMKSMMTTLLNPTTDLAEAITALGYGSGQAMVDALGLVGAYDAIREFGGGAFDGLITNQEALQGALALTGEGAQGFFDTYNAGIDGATEKAQEIQNQGASWDLVRSKWEELSIMAGDTLAPAIIGLIDNQITPLLSGLTEWISQNPEAAQTMLLLAGAVAIASPVLMGLGAIIGVAGGAVGLIGKIGALIGILTGPVGLIVLIGAVAAAILDPEGASAALAKMGEVAKTILKPALDDLSKTLGPVLEQLERLGLATKGGQIANVVGSVQNAINTNPSFNQALTDPVAFAERAFNAALGLAQERFADTPMVIVPSDVVQIPGAVSTAYGGGGAPGSAWGGPVMAGQRRTVGEFGPEQFVAPANGFIDPGGGGITIQNLTIHANDEAGGQAAARSFNEEMKRLLRQRG